MPALTAKEINDHLASGGVVQISTYTKSTIYGPEWAGLFFEDAEGNVYLRRGKATICLTFAGGTSLLVSIRFGRRT